jgi:hypothetical protein
MRCARYWLSLLTALLFLLSVVLPAAGAPPDAPRFGQWSDWIIEGQIPFEYTSNVNVSAFNADEEYDFAWFPKARLGRNYQLADSTRLGITVEISGDIYTRFSLLNAVEGGGTLTLFHKFGLGNAPWLRAFFFGGYKDVQDVARTGRRFEVGLKGGKRFSPRFDASLTYRYTNRDGGNGPVAVPSIPTDVFTQTYHQATISARYLLLEQLQATAGYTFRGGDFDSACTVGNVGTVLAREDVRAIALDPVFNGCVYRLVGFSHSPFVNFSWGFNHHLSLDAGYEFVKGNADHLNYRVHTGKLVLRFQY